VINAIRFEVSHLQSEVVKSNVLIQLNRVSNDIAKRVAEVIGLDAPAPDPTFYHDNSTSFVSIFNDTLPTIATLSVAVLASVKSEESLTQAASIAAALKSSGVTTAIVGENLAPGINITYSSADASVFDGIIVASGAKSLFTNGTSSTYFPANRPLQILVDGYRWGKPVGALGSATPVLQLAGATTTPGVFSGNSTDISNFVSAFEGGLKTFKFVDRFPVDTQ
jgi:catalase